MKIGDYKLEKKLFQNAETTIYEAIGIEDGEKVIIKALSDQYPSHQQLERIKQEYDLGQQLSGSSISNYLRLVPNGNGLAIIQEYFEGDPLDLYLEDEGYFSVPDFLKVALLIVRALGELHEQKIVHRDISADNILLNKEKSAIKIIDFGISTHFNLIGTQRPIGGKVHYISPEQTGRINRIADYRTDFYSLGILYYRMLTGSFPFESDDHYQIIHQHIASKPIAVIDKNKKVPSVISSIIDKLLSKSPDERYQSIKGLENDLSTALEQLGRDGNIKDFKLAQNDFSIIFNMPKRLFGRDKEVEKLQNIWRKCISNKETKFLLVTGGPGLGKSTLVQELKKPLLEDKGFFIQGKYELLQQSIPYSALIQAFDGLMAQLMVEHKTKLEFWKNKLNKALGQNGRLLTEVFPTLERIVGVQPEIENLNPAESQNRFEYVFGEFIKVFTSQPYPIALFLDDLQWVDAASLKLLRNLLKDNQQQKLMIIGAYRDNEVDALHPLSIMLKKVEQDHYVTEQISLEDLDYDVVQEFVSYCLLRPKKQVKDFADQIYQKTKGNPFYMHRFTGSLLDKGFIYPNIKESLWKWDLDAIVNESATENVVDFLVKQIGELPAETIRILSAGAAIGNSFTESEIAGLFEMSEEEVIRLLNPAQTEAFLYKSEGIYVFLHDRIHQAAYAMVSQKPELHLRIGRHFESIVDKESGEDVFHIVNQLNRATVLITKAEDQIDLAKLNVAAALKAKDAVAFEAMKDLLHQASSLLEPYDPWNRYYDLKWQITFEKIEVEYIVGDSDEAYSIAIEALQYAKSELDKAAIYDLLTVFGTMQIRHQKAIESGIQGLSLLGITIPNEKEFEGAIGQYFGQIGAMMAEKQPLDLINGPTIDPSDPAYLQLQLMVNLLSPAYLSGQSNLWTYLVVASTSLSIEKGNIPASCTAYSSYGILCGLVFADHKMGYQYGELAYDLACKLNSKRQLSNSCFVMGAFLNAFARETRHSYEFLQEGLLAGLQSGELQFAGYNISGSSQVTPVEGVSLEVLLQRISTGLDVAEKTKNQFVQGAIGPLLKLYRDLTGVSPSKLKLTDIELLKKIEKEQNLYAILYYHLYSGYVDYLLGDSQKAIICFKNASKLLPAVQGSIVLIDYHSYLPLVALELLDPTKPDQELEQMVEESLTTLEKWNQSVASNFQFRVDLVKAIQKEKEGDYLSALDLYESAIEEASSQEMLPIKAIASEKAGKMMVRLNKSRIGKMFIKDAHLTYREYGAHVKVQQLESQYPSLFEKANRDIKTTHHATMATTRSMEHFDSHSLVKAALAISEEITLKGVLRKMMEVVLENAGAENGYFMLMDEGQLTMESKGSFNPKKYKYLKGVKYPPKNLSEYPPEEIINYVLNTEEPLLLEDAQRSEAYGHLAHFVAHKIKSVLCLPVLWHGQVKAILYLENSLSEGAFTASQLELLQILSSQIAISITNASLYDELENKVAQRTTQLQSRKEELEATLKDLRQTQNQLIQSEKMASLGELTAGIAHEIQNPLNFVNNFSELNRELIEDLKEAIDQDDQEEIAVILTDINQNEQKVTHHGRRAEQIVKSMLQHSRGSSGEKELTDLNALCDEYLRLAFHGLKAKDKSFNADFRLEADRQLPKVNVISQDIGRVLLNLINNAFQAVQDQSGAKVTVVTKKVDDQVQITVTDNGPGIPKDIQDKIFQPFFTTKSTGEGTGLGLSMSYDIVTKGHGGTIGLDSQYESGTTFTISLPVKQPKK